MEIIIVFFDTLTTGYIAWEKSLVKIKSKKVVQFCDFVALLKADFKLRYWLFKKYLLEHKI